MTETIRWEKDADGIVVLTLDDPNQSANTMNRDYATSMEATVARLEAEKDDITGVVITSAKKTFFAGGDLKDIDVIEVNEAFAAVVLRYCQAFDLDPVEVNVNGGAIAMGHPLGATGGMILGTLIDELHRTGGRYGLATLCVGGGMGIATVVEAI